MRINKRKIQKGFTLIELMIAVAIVGILAAVALPAYQNYTIRAQISEAFVLVGGVQTAIVEQIANSGDIAGVMADGGTGLNAISFPINGKYSRVWTIQSGSININFYNNANAKLANKTLLLTPNFDVDGNLTYWTCSGSGISKAWLPSSCN